MSRRSLLLTLLSSLSIAILCFPPSGVRRHRVAAKNDVAAAGLRGAKAAAPAVSFVNAPTVLPRNTPLANYSPLLAIHYDGLGAETYTLKIFLLETGNFFCASNQWCNTPFTINNQSNANSSGNVVVAQNMDVFDYQNFLWVVDLYNQAGTKVASATQPASSTQNRAPVLSPIGNKSATAGQSLDFVVSASDPDNDAVSLSAQNLPPGATFDGATGQFHWQSPTLGTYPSIQFVASQGGMAPLSDAELIDIQVGSAPPAGTLSFGAASYTTGEAGPAVIKVIRTSGSAGAITVKYSTADGTAVSGADYTGAQGTTLTFADGEMTKVIRVPIINDANAEANETFQVQLSAPTEGATPGSPSKATVTIVDDDNPQNAGQWGDVITWPTVPIHMHLLPNGKVMFWDRHNDTFGWDGDPRLWDPASPNMFTTLALPGWDLFCSGHTFTADGRLLVTGGHIADGVGDLKAGIYDPSANSWTPLPNMNAGRWYPTDTILANGDILVIAGTRNGYLDTNPLPQVLQVRSGTWRNLTGALLGAYPAWADFYPFAYLAPNGKVFVAGPQQTARYLDTSGAGAWTDVANSSVSYRDYGSSVMYDDGKVLIVGGNPREPNPNATPTILPDATAEVINLNDPTPAWHQVSPMSVGRRHLNTTLLPDGQVLVTGGSSAPGFDEPAGAVLYAEMWDPATGNWTPLAAETRYRGYHSNALLLPDGRVLVAGGGHPNPSGGSEQNNAEIYSPPYLFKGARPSISTAPTVVTYGETFSVQTRDAAGVTNVNWIRLPSVTHAFNQDQRINHLSFSQAAGGLNVTAPASANLCPPGYYMLFIVNGNGVPSVAKIIQIADTVLQFSGATYGVNEASTSATITVNRVGNSTGTVSVNYATSDGTATASSDYTNTSGTLTFADGVTSQSFGVPISNDALDEPDETVNLALSTPKGGANLGVRSAATLTISDDDPPPALSINDLSVTEGDGGMTNAIFTVTLSAASGRLSIVDYTTADGTAFTPADYQPASGTLTFAPGETSRIITVQVRGDMSDEADETFFVNLSNPVNASIADAQGQGTIVNDDARLVQFSSAAFGASEAAGSATLTVTRTGDTSGAASVNYATSDGTASERSDYTTALGTLRFAAGEASKTITVFVTDDVFVEPTETFSVALSAPQGAALGSPSTATVTVSSDDTTPGGNPLDGAQFFVRQHYRDFLNREPDTPGLIFWVGQTTACGNPDPLVCRINVSGAFFLSIEFQETGFYAIRVQRVAFGRRSDNASTRITYRELIHDQRQIGEGVIVGQAGYEQVLDANKQAYASSIAARTDFAARFPQTTADTYVDALFSSAGVTSTPNERQNAINAYNGAGGAAGRTAALRSAADSASVRSAEFRTAFVLLQYHGYLRRNPTDAPDTSDIGYQFWLSKLNQFNGNYVAAEMVKAFITSDEYRHRFGQ